MESKTEYKIYSVENYRLVESKWDSRSIKNESLKKICKCLETDKSYHLRLKDGNVYTLYLDLDGYIYEVSKFIDDLKKFMNFRYGISIDELSYTKNTEKKGSYHISVPSFNASTQKQKEIVINLKNYVDEHTKKSLDTTVYSDKWFRLPNQTKGVSGAKKGKENETIILAHHKIEKGEMKDFFLDYIPSDSVNIDNVKFIMTESEKNEFNKKKEKDDFKNEFKKEYKKKESKKELEKLGEKILGEITDTDAEIEKIKLFLDILDKKYYDEYSEWYKIMFILKNFEKNTNSDMLEIFINFSKKSKKCNVADITEKWKYLENYDISLNLSSLYYYAKESNIEKYKTILKDMHRKKNIFVTEKYLAEKIKELAGHLFFYKNKTFYAFDTKLNFWYEDRYEILKKFINDNLFNYINLYLHDSIEDMNIFKNQSNLLMTYCLSNTGQQKVCDTFKNRFFNESKSDINFDEKHYLLGFSNGVYNLLKNKFRNYKYSDYMTTQTGFNYRESTEEEERKMHEVLDTIETEKDKKDFLLQILSTGLIGKSYQKFIIYSGNGSNGKGFINSLMSGCLGDYYYQGKVITLCTEEKEGGNPEIACMDKKRYIVFSEPKQGSKINNGKLKSWTGDKNINARMLFSNKTQVQMVATITMECNLHIYLQDEATNGETRRIVDFPFLSTFVEEQDKAMVSEKDRIYLKNKDFGNESFINKYKYGLLKILINRAHKFLTTDNESFNIPQSVIEKSNFYINKSYPQLTVLNDCATFTNDTNDFIKISDLYDNMKITDNYINSSKDEKRKLNKKSMIEFYKTNKATAKYYVNNLSTTKNNVVVRATNILKCYKFNENVDDQDLN